LHVHKAQAESLKLRKFSGAEEVRVKRRGYHTAVKKNQGRKEEEGRRARRRERRR
jgi:hypothetical protein